MNEINETGGAYIGNGRATAPFATLKVNKHMLQLNAGLIGNLVFRSSDIVSINRSGGILGVGGGVSINHKVSTYKQKVVFLPAGNSAELIDQITQLGFLTSTEPIPPETEQFISTMQASGVYPIKSSAIVAIVVIWNIFFIPSFYSSFIKGTPNFHSIGPRISLGLMFLLCLSLLVSPKVRHLVLKEGRTIDGLRISLYFMMLILGILFISFSFIP